MAATNAEIIESEEAIAIQAAVAQGTQELLDEHSAEALISRLYGTTYYPLVQKARLVAWPILNQTLNVPTTVPVVEVLQVAYKADDRRLHYARFTSSFQYEEWVNARLGRKATHFALSEFHETVFGQFRAKPVTVALL